MVSVQKLAALAVMSDSSTSKSASPPSSAAAAILGDRLFLSAVGPAQDLKFLQNHKVTHILNLTGPGRDGKPRYPNKYPDKFKYLHICQRDEQDTDIKDYLEKGHPFIRNALKAEEGKQNNVVLVHCEAGISRSATTVITYLMKYDSMRLRDAYHHVKKRKTNIGPNSGFFRQCIALDKKIFGEASERDPSKDIELEEYLAMQMLGPGGMFAPYVKSGKISIEKVYEELKNNNCNIQATQNKFLDLLLF
mmetsp:Transcript_31232/g.76190  ORF Transcript_31232/g.76190 Transcript_31232/m.76190 type:complete len:249 (-) Transcript_31232:132-878(-)